MRLGARAVELARLERRLVQLDAAARLGRRLAHRLGRCLGRRLAVDADAREHDELHDRVALTVLGQRSTERGGRLVVDARAEQQPVYAQQRTAHPLGVVQVDGDLLDARVRCGSRELAQVRFGLDDAY